MFICNVFKSSYCSNSILMQSCISLRKLITQCMFNECTKVQNTRCTCVRESLKTHVLLKRTLIMCNRKYTEDYRGKMETKEKKIAALHPVVFQVVFSLLLSLFRTLRRLCCRKSARNVAAVLS